MDYFDVSERNMYYIKKIDNVQKL